MNKFTVGQKVKIVKDCLGVKAEGKIGKVEFVAKGSICQYLVYLGEDFKGHAGGCMDNNHNWWFCEDDLEAVTETVQYLSKN